MTAEAEKEARKAVATTNIRATFVPKVAGMTWRIAAGACDQGIFVKIIGGHGEGDQRPPTSRASCTSGRGEPVLLR